VHTYFCTLVLSIVTLVKHASLIFLVPYKNMQYTFFFKPGTLPDTLGSLSSLSILYLSNLRLSDTLPTSIGQLNNLQTMYIWGTSLKGTLPTSFGSLTKLTGLLIYYSSFTGVPYARQYLRMIICRNTCRYAYKHIVLAPRYV
jgi:Leucine-rich repeat (LRR) protein